MENALKGLDKLTQEEARMATAQNLKVTHAVDKSVKEVMDTVVTIDDGVARVDGRVATVNNRVVSVDNTVKGVDDKVEIVDSKVTEVIAGVYSILKSISANVLKTGPLRWKDDSRMRRSSETFVVSHSQKYWI